MIDRRFARWPSSLVVATMLTALVLLIGCAGRADAPKPESPVATVWAFERMEPSPRRASLVWKGSNIKPDFKDPFGLPQSVERYPETYPMRKQYPDLAGWHDMAQCVVKYPNGEVTFWDLGRETPQSQWIILGAAHAP